MRLDEALATLLGVGRVGVAGGTLASVLGFSACLLGLPPLPAALVSTALGLWGCHLYLRRTGLEDPPEVVVDELCGYLWSVAFLDRGYLLPALFLFRVFDIIKPFPVGHLERLPGAIGVMADDLGAGLLTFALLFGFEKLFYGGLLLRLWG